MGRSGSYDFWMQHELQEQLERCGTHSILMGTLHIRQLPMLQALQCTFSDQGIEALMFHHHTHCLLSTSEARWCLQTPLLWVICRDVGSA